MTVELASCVPVKLSLKMPDQTARISTAELERNRGVLAFGSRMRWRATSDMRVMSAILAVTILLSGIPLTGGVMIVSGPSHPEYTVNICHPIQSFDRVPALTSWF